MRELKEIRRMLEDLENELKNIEDMDDKCEKEMQDKIDAARKKFAKEHTTVSKEEMMDIVADELVDVHKAFGDTALITILVPILMQFSASVVKKMFSKKNNDNNNAKEEN